MAKKTEKKATFPKALGECIDLAYTIRAARIEKQREFDAEIAVMKKEEQLLEDHILDKFDKSELNGAKGNVASASLIILAVPQAKDWNKIYAFIKENNAFDLLEKRLARLAFRDRLEAGVVVPGVEVFQKQDLSLTKIG
jgi:hypothetical protein